MSNISASLSALLLVLSICLVGCRRAPQFTGRLVIYSDHNLYSVSAGGRHVSTTTIAQHVTSAAVSPDNRYLIYSRSKDEQVEAESDRGDTVLQDLSSGVEKSLFAFQVFGLSWSTDSRRFSFTHLHKLYVSTLDGPSELVYSEPSKSYVGIGRKDQTIFAASSTAMWVGSDSFLLQTGGEFPGYVAGGSLLDQNGIQPDKTEFAATGKQFKLDSLKERWFVGDRCIPQSLAVFAKAGFASREDSGTWEFRVGPPLFLAHDFLAFEHSTLRPLAYEHVDFMPRSCRLYAIVPTGSDGGFGIKFIDPATLKATDGPALAGGRSPLLSIADSRDQFIAILFSIPDDPANQDPFEKNPDPNRYELSIVDTATGTEAELLAGTRLKSAELPAHMRDLKLLAWLEK